MAKKSILDEVQETIVEGAKTGMAVAKLAATAGLAAGGPVAAGVVLDSVSKGLRRAEQKAANVAPSKAALKKRTRTKPPAKRKKAAAKKRPSPKKKKATRAKAVAKKTAKTKRGRSRRKR
jgi:hypothetical protein